MAPSKKAKVTLINKSTIFRLAVKLGGGWVTIFKKVRPDVRKKSGAWFDDQRRRFKIVEKTQHFHQVQYADDDVTRIWRERDRIIFSICGSLYLDDVKFVSD